MRRALCGQKGCDIVNAPEGRHPGSRKADDSTLKMTRDDHIWFFSLPGQRTVGPDMRKPMTDPLDALRRQAKTLQKQYQAGDKAALERVDAQLPRKPEALKRADFLHVIAIENSFATWPQMKEAVAMLGMDRAAKVQRLKIALAHGQTGVVTALLADTPDLAKGHFGLQVALLEDGPVLAALAADPGLAVCPVGPRKPLIHLAFSRSIHIWPERAGAMLAIAEALVANGADVNEPWMQGEARLSPLYGAIGHADNMALGRWLLDHGADPNDGESLYHATELGHHEGLKMLLEHGAKPNGTNALLRAMDFDDVAAVQMLLAAGADPNAFECDPVGGEAPWVIPALHQAARRQVSDEMCRVLLDAGADPAREYQWASAYGFARVFGHAGLAKMIAAKGAVPRLTKEEELLAMAATGTVPEGVYLDEAQLPKAYENIIREIVHLPGKLPHIKALVALGLFYDKPDDQGLPPVQIAGWEGLPDVMSYFLSLRPDLSHTNTYGGTLLSTIIHGSENAPDRANRDHLGCARIVLEHGVALPKQAVRLAGEPAMAALLKDWAAAHPGQVTGG